MLKFAGIRSATAGVVLQPNRIASNRNTHPTIIILIISSLYLSRPIMAPTATAPTPGAATTTTTSSTPTSASAPQPTSLEEANQRYLSTKLSLRTGLANKRLIDRSLVDLESQIYLFEGSYLATTATSGGNIVKGFDGYLKNSSTGGGRSNSSNNVAGAGEVAVEDRIFSLSSATWQKSLEMKANEGVDPSAAVEERESTPPVSTKKSKEKDTTGTVKKKKDKGEAGEGKGRDKERSETPNVKGSSAGKAGDGDGRGSAGATPTKSTGGKASGAGTATKLKRKNLEGVGSGGSAASTPTGKAAKRKKDDD